MMLHLLRKILVIVLLFLFIGTSTIPGIVDNDNIDKKDSEFMVIENKQRQTIGGWSDNFDSYDTGSSLHGQGGWKGWNNNPDLTAYVVDDLFLSEPHSVNIKENSDLVHEFTEYTSGKWIFIAWQYIPDDFSGQSYFIMLSDYVDGAGQNNKWAVQILFDSVGIVSSDYDNVNLPLITGQWVELRTNIDLDTDWFEFYYGSELLISKAWTAEPNNEYGGILNIGAVNLFANGASSVYYDDLSLERPQPLLCDAGGPYDGIVDEEIQFDGTADGGTQPYEYLWEFGNGDTATIEDPNYAYIEHGIYTVNLTVTDANQNIAWDDTSVTIKGVMPILEIVNITGGLFKVTAVIKNIGFADATRIEWSITLTGGIILLGKETSGNILSIPAGGESKISSSLIIGFGKTTITVCAEISESSDIKEQEALILLFFIV